MPGVARSLKQGFRAVGSVNAAYNTNLGQVDLIRCCSCFSDLADNLQLFEIVRVVDKHCCAPVCASSDSDGCQTVFL